MLISIIMPTCNQGAFIEKAIKSVLLQGDVQYELLIYDACSDDNTSEILSKYSDHERIKKKKKKDDGQIDALNRGLDNAKGEVLAWLNSDDLLLPNALESILNALSSDQDTDFVYGDALEIGYDGAVYYPNVFTENPVAERYLFSHNFICQPTCFFKRAVWDAAKPLDADRAWTFDYTFFASFFSLGLKGQRLDRFIAANRQYPETKTNQGLFKRYLEQMRMILSRAGKPIWNRKALAVYSLEAIIKSLESWNSSDEASFNSLPKAILPKLHEWFLKLVNPREKAAIIARFQNWQTTEGWANIDEWLEANTSMLNNETR